MNTVHHSAPTERSPLQQTKTGERITTYSIALVVGIVVVLIGSAVMVATTESAADGDRLLNAIVPIAQLIVSLATLALVRRSMSVAVRDGEQAERTARHLRDLTSAVRELQDAVRNRTRPPATEGGATTRR